MALMFYVIQLTNNPTIRPACGTMSPRLEDLMTVSFDVISIGCLSRNRFWQEQQPVRTPHATTTVIRSEGKAILVDPSLPGEMLAHRLNERTGLKPDQIDVVFLTTFQPVHRRGLTVFDDATWLMHEPEIAAYRDHLAGLLNADEGADAEQEQLIRDELALLERVSPAPDKITQHVHLFPTPGVTPGSCALLVVPPTATIAIAGDVVINRDYLEHGRAFERCTDAEQAVESLREILEIADQIVCGHDNVILRSSRGLTAELG